MRSLVVLPTYNEAANVLPIVHDILSQDPNLEVLVVDDNSPDGTADLVAEAKRESPRVHLLRRPKKLGLGSAYLAGFEYALERDYRRILTMDCDGSHDPKYLPEILTRSLEYDLVIGSRYVPGGGVRNWSLLRRMLSRTANAYTRLLLRLPVKDCTAGFRCYSRDVLLGVEPFSIRASGYAFLEEMVWRVQRSGFRIAEIPIIFVDRTRGSSKISSAEIYRAIWHVLLLAFRPPTLPPPRILEADNNESESIGTETRDH
jgi:dolichol-phosphate mannosyltransferase